MDHADYILLFFFPLFILFYFNSIHFTIIKMSTYINEKSSCPRPSIVPMETTTTVIDMPDEGYGNIIKNDYSLK